jgi:hypothetical protein
MGLRVEEGESLQAWPERCGVFADDERINRTVLVAATMNVAPTTEWIPIAAKIAARPSTTFPTKNAESGKKSAVIQTTPTTVGSRTHNEMS